LNPLDVIFFSFATPCDEVFELISVDYIVCRLLKGFKMKRVFKKKLLKIRKEDKVES